MFLSGFKDRLGHLIPPTISCLSRNSYLNVILATTLPVDYGEYMSFVVSVGFLLYLDI